MYEWEGRQYGDFSHIRHPPIGLFVEPPQHNVPQKISFFMKIYDYENKNTVQIDKLQKSKFYCFHPCHWDQADSESLRKRNAEKCENYQNPTTLRVPIECQRFAT